MRNMPGGEESEPHCLRHSGGDPGGSRGRMRFRVGVWGATWASWAFTLCASVISAVLAKDPFRAGNSNRRKSSGVKSRIPVDLTGRGLQRCQMLELGLQDDLGPRTGKPSGSLL